MAMLSDFEKAKGVSITAPAYGPNGLEFGKEKATNLIEGGGLLYFSSFWDRRKTLAARGVVEKLLLNARA